MSTLPSEFEHNAASLNKLKSTLQELGADMAVFKALPKNANDKNQIYFSSSFSSLYNHFDLTIADRGSSQSETKARSDPGNMITEAVFNSFEWVKRDNSKVKAKNVKIIVYPQYPEARLSGFQTVENSMPASLSITYTKANPLVDRILVLGRLPGGACIGLIILDPSDSLKSEIEALPGLEGSKVCKLLKLTEDKTNKLQGKLSPLFSQPMKGCKLDSSGDTIPFTGTQVCGYTLEHALGIIPNSNKDGDLYGIELKTHTQLKVTLFTPEPDFGKYTESFEKFMVEYGYKSGEDWRLTGVHRANIRCAKSGLTLKVQEYRTKTLPGQKPAWILDIDGNRKAFPYDKKKSLTSKMGAVEVVLATDNGEIAAGWSLERLMNNWGVKHDEVVYISAKRALNKNVVEVNAGYKYLITFSPKVLWCNGTSAERLLEAIDSGLIFLDPAPKYAPYDVSKNKRRAQWRVNNISKAVSQLYESVESKDLT